MSFGLNTSTSTGQELANDVTVANPPEDTVSSLAFSPVADMLAVASWDKKVRIYDIDPNTGNNQGRALYEHDAPVFSAQWTYDGTKVVLGGADKQVKLFDLQSQQAQQIGQHDAPVKDVRYVECGPTNTPVVALGSWDKTLRYWDMRLPQPVSTLNLPERVYAMDLSQKLLVIGCAERHVAIIDLSNPQQIFKTTTSPLKYQIRTIACYPTGNGYAIGSVEGRAAIQYIDDAEQSKLGFSFKCHRRTNGPANIGTNTLSLRPSSVPALAAHAYAVNLIAFHPIYGTFSTAGLDGTFCYWDKDAKQRLKTFPAVNYSISASDFSRDGRLFAYSLGYDWSQGHMGNRQDYPNQIKLHATKDEEVKQRDKKRM